MTVKTYDTKSYESSAAYFRERWPEGRGLGRNCEFYFNKCLAAMGARRSKGDC